MSPLPGLTQGDCVALTVPFRKKIPSNACVHRSCLVPRLRWRTREFTPVPKQLHASDEASCRCATRPPFGTVGPPRLLVAPQFANTPVPHQLPAESRTRSYPKMAEGALMMPQC